MNGLPRTLQASPTISILTPVFNGQPYIKNCIQNVIDQGCPQAEHIIIDGGSTDGTVEIIRDYAARCTHIRWISEMDRGQSDAMNKGIRIAQGEILGILNVDDFYEENALKRILETFKALPFPSFVVGNCNVWDEEGKLCAINKPARLKLRHLLLGHMMNPYPINPSAYFYHTKLHNLIGYYNVELHYEMDLDFILKAVQVARTTYINTTLGNYRCIRGTKTFESSRNGQTKKRVEDLLRYYRKDLPRMQQIFTATEYAILNSRLFLPILYFRKHPTEFMPRLRARLHLPHRTHGGRSK